MKAIKLAGLEPANVFGYFEKICSIPHGSRNTKKISDYLTDKKYTLYQKEQQCVVCCGKDIVWIVNERIDHRFRITEDTRRVLIISVRKEKRMR